MSRPMNASESPARSAANRTPRSTAHLTTGIVALSSLISLTACDRTAESHASPGSSGYSVQSDDTPRFAEFDSLSASGGAMYDFLADDSETIRPDAPVASPFIPPPYSGIYPEEEAALLTGEFIFEPDPIPDEGVPVGDAALTPGEILQVYSGGFWWAGTVLKIISDNEVLIGYFGWDESCDETKDRMDLKFNPRAAQAAVYTKYWPIVF